MAQDLSYNDIRGAKQIWVFGDACGHGDQVMIGKVSSVKHRGKYFAMYSNDGYPNRMGAGGFLRLIPDSYVQNHQISVQNVRLCMAGYCDAPCRFDPAGDIDLSGL